MDMKQKWLNHANFLSDLACHVADLATADGQDKIEAIENYTLFLSKCCMEHAQKHCENDKTPPCLRVSEKCNPKVKDYPKDVTWGHSDKGWVSTQDEVAEAWEKNEKKFEVQPPA